MTSRDRSGGDFSRREFIKSAMGAASVAAGSTLFGGAAFAANAASVCDGSRDLHLVNGRFLTMDGFETADLIRQNERLRHVPIIFLSAIDTLEADVYRGAAKGAVDYLFKPVVPEVLKAKVSVFVDLFHINERLKLKAIQQSEERFRLLVESMTLQDLVGHLICHCHRARDP